MAPAKDETVRQLMQPIAALLARAEVTEITINRPLELWTRSDHRWHLHEIPEFTESRIRALAGAIISFNKIPAAPIVSVVLPGGERGQIVIPPACIDGTCSISIRKHMGIAKTLYQLTAEGVFDDVRDVSFNRPSIHEAESRLEMIGPGRLDEEEVELLTMKHQGRIAEFLSNAVKMKRNIVIGGKMGSGKSLLARSLINEVPTWERIITIQDVPETELNNHPNHVHMIFGAGTGMVSAVDCLRSVTRQSGDRTFLMEMRGDEAWEYFLSLSIGTPGGISTIHSNSALATFHRMESLVSQSPVGRTITAEAIRDMIYRTVDVVVWMRNWKVKEIYYDPIFAKERAI